MQKFMLADPGAHDPGGGATRRVLFLNLGRGGLSRFTLELARSLAGMPHILPTFCLPRQHELFEPLAASGCEVAAADGGDGANAAQANGHPVEILRRNLESVLARHRPAGVVTLIPHIWSPLLVPAIRSRGIRYVTVIHEARPHPRDPARLTNGWALRDAAGADTAVTLGQSVTDILSATGAVPRHKLVTLFHPDLTFGRAGPARPPGPAGPFRVLVLSAGQACDGLAAVTGAIELLRARGLPVALGVFGEARPGPPRHRFPGVCAGAENRPWPDADTQAVLLRHDAVVLVPGAHTGPVVAAIALGAGLPLIGCRGDRLPEHLKDGATGLIADGADPPNLAVAIGRLAADRTLYAGIRAHIRRSAWERSMGRFAAHLVALATDPPPLRGSYAPPAVTWV